MALPANDFGPLLNFVGVKAKAAAGRAGWSIETMRGDQLCQPDLYASEIARRRAH